jgi:hypothetical protein
VSGHVSALLRKAVTLFHQYCSSGVRQQCAERMAASTARLPRHIKGTAQQCLMVRNRFAGIESLRHQSPSNFDHTALSIEVARLRGLVGLLCYR